MKRKTLVDLTQEPDGTITDTSVNTAWSIQDEAIHRGVNYADHTMGILIGQDWQPLVHTLLKEAYQQGFLHGFEHKFDDTNYEGDK